MSTRPDLLLVHGAWHGPWAWDALRPELPAGEVRTVALPSSGPDPDPEAVFYGDVAPELAAACADRLTHQSLAALGATLADAAWRHVPTSYVVCVRDAAIPAPLQEEMAGHAVRVHHLDASHSPFLSVPAELAALIEEEVAAFTR
ncbi:alpha/beta fold hydrolase [Pseudonocardia broussonetiae]|uniref:Alpha/beta fold hydrolase n=1 Tax=Pseudonocardia broussonetiae TaxID=2736640 RepID=A0A6M6JSK1_9PSEU|nr:alpha/beta fold hydrolase [Pseudonocardia broussonetiae]QJY49399.1 alpha/beta fold hydrolase [Pseudonocardia broussonetiae]